MKYPDNGAVSSVRRAARLNIRFSGMRLRKSLATAFRFLGIDATSELYFRALTRDVANRHNLRLPPLVATGSAANWSLLYLVCRSALEGGITKVCEIGGGETTILLNHFQTSVGYTHEVVETDEEWCRRISDRINRRLPVTGLAEKVISRRPALGFTPVPTGPFDLVVVDGPVGTPRWSRWSALEILERLASDFIVIFDDVERRGEQDLVREFIRANPNAGRRFYYGSKAQCVVFDGAGRVVEHW